MTRRLQQFLMGSTNCNNLKQKTQITLV